jgi:hypothetical protein
MLWADARVFVRHIARNSSPPGNAGIAFPVEVRCAALLIPVGHGKAEKSLIATLRHIVH